VNATIASIPVTQPKAAVVVEKDWLVDGNLPVYLQSSPYKHRPLDSRPRSASAVNLRRSDVMHQHPIQLVYPTPAAGTEQRQARQQQQQQEQEAEEELPIYMEKGRGRNGRQSCHKHSYGYNNSKIAAVQHECSRPSRAFDSTSYRPGCCPSRWRWDAQS
jgi:hypothetical protein